MSYAILDAEIRATTHKLEAGLARADQMLENFMGRRTTLKMGLDTQTMLVPQLRQVKKMLSEIGHVNAQVTMSVNGVPVAVKQIQQQGAALNKLEADAKSATAGIKGLVSATREQRAAGAARATNIDAGRYETVRGGTRVDAAHHEAIRRQAEADIKRVTQLTKQQAIEASRFQDAINKTMADSANARLQQVKTAMGQASQLARRQEAERVRAGGTIASVVGGERNINAAVPMAGVLGSQRGLQQLSAELAMYDSKIKQAQANTRQFAAELKRSAASADSLRSRLNGAFNNYISGVQKAYTEKKALTNQTGMFTGALQKAIRTISAFATGYLVIRGATALFRGLSESVIGFNSLLEKTDIAFTNMLGSAQKSQQLLGQLRKFALETPFQFKELVPLTRQLVALGVVSKEEVLDKAIPALRAMGNRVAALGMGSEAIYRINLALGQMTMKGKASAEEITKQLGELVPASRYVAEAMGVSVAQLFELMRKGQVDGRKAAQAIMAGIQRDNAGMMDVMVNTYEGAMNKIGDATNIVLSEGLKPLFEWLSKTAQAVGTIATTEAFGKWSFERLQKIASVIMAIGRAFAWTATTIGDKMPYIAAALTVITAQKIILGLLGLKAAILAVGMGTATASQIATLALGKWLIGILAFVAAYRNIGAVRTMTANVVNGVVDMMKEMSVVVAQSVETVAGLLGKFGSMIPDLSAARFIPGMPPGLVQAADAMRKVLAGLDGQQAGLAASVEDYWAGVVSRTKQRVEDFEKFATQGVSGASGFAEMMADARREIAAASKEIEKIPEMPKFGPMNEGDAEAGKKRTAALKLEKDQLQDLIKMYDLKAKAVEQSAKRQMDAFSSVRDRFRDMFSAVQNALLSEGVINNPLGPIIQGFEKWIGLEPKMRALAKATSSVMDNLNREKGVAQSRLDRLTGGDGAGPGYGNSGSTANVAASTIDAMARSIRTPRGMASCANFAGNLLGQMGIEVKRSNVARDLAHNMLRAGGQRLPVSQAQAGDLIVYRGARYGKMKYNEAGPNIGGYGRGNNRVGYHVGVAAGDGMMWDSNFDPRTGEGRHKKQRIYRPQDAFAIRASGVGNMIPQGKLPGYIPKNNVTALAEALNMDVSMFENIDGTISKIKEVPKSWGAAVRDSVEHTSQFAAQTALADKEFQAFLSLVTGRSMDDAIRWLRQFAEMADKVRLHIQAVHAAQSQIADLDKRSRMRGREDDPMTALEEYLTHDPVGKHTPLEETVGLWWKTRKDIMEEAQLSTRRYINSERDRIAVLKEGDELLQADTVALMKRQRVLDIAAKKMEIARSVEITNLRRVNPEGAIQRELQQLETFISGYDQTKERDLTADILGSTAALKDRVTMLQMEQDMVRAGVMAEQEISEAIEIETRKREALNKVMATEFKDPARREELTRSIEQAAWYEKFINLLVKTIDRTKELNALREQTKKTLVAIRAEQSAMLSLPEYSPALERKLALLREEARLRADSKKYSDQEIKDRVGEFAKVFDAETTTRGIAEYTRLIGDAQRATATFGDTTGLAGVQFEIFHGRMGAGMTVMQKFIAMFAAAKAAATADANNALDATRQQVIGMREQLEIRKLEISQRGRLAELQRQELQWKYEDSKIKIPHSPERTKQINDEREAVRKLILELNELRKYDFIQQAGDDIDLMRIPPGMEQDMARLKQQWMRDGFTQEEIDQMMPWARARAEMQELNDAMRQNTDEMKSIFNNALAQIETEGFGGFFRGILSGVADFLNKLARQIITNWAIQQLMNMIPGMAGLGGITQAANQPLTLPGQGGFTPSFVPPSVPNYGGAFSVGASVPVEMLAGQHGVQGAATATAAPITFTGNVSFPGVRREEDIPSAVRNHSALSRRSAQQHAQRLVGVNQ